MTTNQIGPFSDQQIARAFSPVTTGAALQVREVLTGNINTILKVEGAGQHYGLRVRTQESVYRYEPDLIKEVFVLQLLQSAGDGPNDARIAAAFKQLFAAQYGTVTQRVSLAPSVRYFDWSRQLLPHPYCIYEWVDGEPLWNLPEPRLYALAGAALAQIHQVQFSAFYADFLSIGERPVSWNERFQAAVSKEIAGAQPRLEDDLVKLLTKLTIPGTVNCTPCLVHNDFAPGNILVHCGCLAAVIDWDNAVIEAPHLDFVKMKYWTAKNVDGELVHKPELFTAFVDGYGAAGQEIANSPLFALYEVLWLLRVFNFEKSKEAQGLARAPGYPAAAVYARYLAKVLGKIK
ncbi:MAG: aminoglycoside phosphotransferase family protein [Deltaproteobacteria bacterium]|nr:aminoglycoside phosphotransferase family protein [Deltaproteobacteria bacterium]